MQMNEQVLTALEVLRDFAENDFELHRIDVLEKDLNEPPKVEVIDDTHQKFNGVVYTSSKESHLQNHAMIHRDIYQYYYGEIPAGYEIHHKDFNKFNNNIFNLQMIIKKEHSLIHSKQKTVTATHVCKYCGKVFTSTTMNDISLFCSKTCAYKYSYKNDKETRICEHCGKEYDVYKYAKNRCCSRHCAQQRRNKKTKLE